MLTLSNTPGWLVPALITAFVTVCIVMMLVILIQKPKGGGLSGAFGGAGGGGSEMAAFGAKTGDVLTWFTVILFVCFLLLAMGLTWTIRADVADSPTPAQQPAGASPAPEVDPEAVREMLGGREDEGVETDTDVPEPAGDPSPADEPANGPAPQQTP
ncbi:MAG: preprotein translocase subunit SecG [Phycisphaeraceae bacterium]